MTDQQQSTQDSGQQQATNQSGQTQNTEPPDWYKNPPEWLKNVQQAAQQQQQQPPQQSSGQSGQTVGQTLLDAVNALPEKIVNSLKEANPPKVTDQQVAQQGANNGSQQAPGKRSFREWWFNG